MIQREVEPGVEDQKNETEFGENFNDLALAGIYPRRVQDCAENQVADYRALAQSAGDDDRRYSQRQQRNDGRDRGKDQTRIH